MSYLALGHSVECAYLDKTTKFYSYVGRTEEIMESILSHSGVKRLKATPAQMPPYRCVMGRVIFFLPSSEKLKISAGPLAASSFMSDIIIDFCFRFECVSKRDVAH